ncbi:MAG: hypothetical protein HY421_00890 [Candidatus Kerfeldbacteria bacterium]|nr:hypothetical protein [Candidatus Kerfeldbacteria bacterium]
MAQVKDSLSLRFGYWVAVHRDQLRTWWAISIIAIDIVLLLYFVAAFTRFSFTTVRTVTYVGELAAPLVSPAVRSALSPRDLEIGRATALERGVGRYDLAAPVTNPNASWLAAEVRYRFSYGQATREEKTVVWPGSQSYLAQLNVALPPPPAGSAPQAEVVSVQWQRPDTPDRFSGVSFPVSNVVLRSVATVSGSPATRLTATVRNSSVYGFRLVRLTVILRQGSTTVAVGEAVFERLTSLEERPVEVTWLSSLPLNAEAAFYPTVNLLDQSNFL